MKLALITACLASIGLAAPVPIEGVAGLSRQPYRCGNGLLGLCLHGEVRPQLRKLLGGNSGGSLGELLKELGVLVETANLPASNTAASPSPSPASPAPSPVPAKS